MDNGQIVNRIQAGENEQENMTLLWQQNQNFITMIARSIVPVRKWKIWSKRAISDCMKQSGIMMHHQEYHSSIMRRSGSGKSCAGILITVVEWFGFQHMQSIRCSVYKKIKK